MALAKPRGLLLDLFGTVVEFLPHVPTVQVAGAARRSTMGWLQNAAERLVPGVAFEQLQAALMQSSEQIVRSRPPEFLEVPSCVRFERALALVGVTQPQCSQLARELSLAHMAHLASLTFLPGENRALLDELRAGFRLALVSNFDHAPTARQILIDNGILDRFDAVLISEEFGRRKPHPAIFRAALSALELGSAEALFVGDSLADDVAGARAAGVPVVWIDGKDEGLPAGAAAPDAVIRQLVDLRSILS